MSLPLALVAHRIEPALRGDFICQRVKYYDTMMSYIIGRNHDRRSPLGVPEGPGGESYPLARKPVLQRLKAARGPGESYCDTILRRASERARRVTRRFYIYCFYYR